MASPRSCSVLFAAAAVLTACSDLPTNPLSRPTILARAIVERPDAAPGFFFGGDPRDGLAVAVGYITPIASLAEICADPTASDIPVTGGRLQFVSTPSGSVQATFTSAHEAVTVFRYGEGIVTSACQLVGAPVVATGTVTVSLHQTKVTGEGPGASLFGATLEGLVTLTSGGTARIHGTLQFVVRPDGSIQIDRERVSLTPL